MKTDLIRSGKVNEWRGFAAHAAMSSSATAIGEGGYDQDDGIRGVCAETKRWFSYATNGQTRLRLLDWIVIGRRRFCMSADQKSRDTLVMALRDSTAAHAH